MSFAAFLAYRRTFLRLLRTILRRYPKDTFYEQAVLSYTHANPIAQIIFWERLRLVIGLIPKDRRTHAIDFGTGSGVLLPHLHATHRHVTAVDVEPELVEMVIQAARLSRVTLLSNPEELEQLPPGSVDTIVAMDVLEHVENVPHLARIFARILRPGGSLIVSGPTETPLYKLGRKLAGYEHHSHVRTIRHIEDDLAEVFQPVALRRLPFLQPLVLFRITRWEPRASAQGPA